MNNLQKTLETLYLDYINNFITVKGFAEYYDMSEDFALALLREAQNNYTNKLFK